MQTSFGLLTVYGTTIGVFGGKAERFNEDFKSQSLNFENRTGNFCIAGDLNVVLSGYPYPSYNARNELNEIFDKLNLKCITSEISDSVDHIAISKGYITNQNSTIAIWNEDKALSDHIGICIELF